MSAPPATTPSAPPPRPALLEALDPDVRPAEVPVLIIGGGPVGLSAAVLLAQRGIAPLVLERRDFSVRHPRAHLLNVRTMEVFAEMGVAQDIYALGPPDDRWRKATWWTSVAGPGATQGRKIGEVQAWGGGTDAVRYAAASPRRFTNLPQTRLDPLLRAHAGAACPGRIRPHQEVVGIEIRPGEAGAEVVVLDRERGDEYRVGARYVIAADGGRVSAQLLGVELEGPREIREVVNQYVTSNLELWDEPDALLAHFISPLGRGQGAGTLQALGPNAYGRESEQWLVAVAPAAVADGHPAADGAPVSEPTLDDARRMLGLDPGHPMQLHARSHWHHEGVVATRFRHGPVFLAGDAAHRHPPTGGLGLNGGVQDAHNLAWKLAAVLDGSAPDRLLDSYEAERRPIAAAYAAHSLENAGRHRPIAAALGLRPGQSEAEGWRELAVWVSETPEGEQRRAAVAEAVAANAADYSQLGVEAGFWYSCGALVPDGTPPPDDHDSPIAFTPTNRPGHHLAHVWLMRGPKRVSTVELVATRGLTLFCGDAGAERWRAAAAAVGGPAPAYPVHVVVVGGGREVADPDGEWAALCAIDPAGALLVRPDRHVAWRGTAGPAEAGRRLHEVVASVMAGGNLEGGREAAEPHLRRIHVAAERLRR